MADVDAIRREVCALHAELVASGLVAWTSGNVSARVPDTDLVVVVQQPYEEAVAPHRAFFRRFLEWVAGAAVVGVLLVGGLWLARSRHKKSSL